MRYFAPNPSPEVLDEEGTHTFVVPRGAAATDFKAIRHMLTEEKEVRIVDARAVPGGLGSWSLEKNGFTVIRAPPAMDFADREAVKREYYPKLLVAVPFTPVTGCRLLTDPQHDTDQLAPVLVRGLRTLAEKLEVSSVHCLFSTSSDNRYFRDFDFVDRTSHQFHWQNDGYQDFHDFLGSLSSKKRKNITRERRRVREAGIRMSWLDQSEVTDQTVDFFFACYRNTIAEHGSYLYLNRDFFQSVCTNLPDHVRMLVAEKDGNPVAAAFFLCGQHSLYGRYWGALEWIPDLHFETCYYAPIEYCIANGLSRFEAGAQGEHKLSRGLMPARTLSAHWLSHSGFHDAVERYTREERRDIERYTAVLAEHSPFRRG